MADRDEKGGRVLPAAIDDPEDRWLRAVR